MAITVVERFKQESYVWTVRRDKKWWPLYRDVLLLENVVIGQSLFKCVGLKVHTVKRIYVFVYKKHTSYFL